MVKKDKRTYRNFKYWSIDKLQEVLESAHITGVDGHDYYSYKEEMQETLWEKQNKLFQDNIQKDIDKYNAMC